MPPRRSARVADLVDRQTSALAPLPLPVVHKIFLMLAADERGRASCVCRGWRLVLAEPSLWSCLGDGDLPYRRNSAPQLLGATRRARGLLHRLHVSPYYPELVGTALLEVVTANAGVWHLFYVAVCACLPSRFNPSSTGSLRELSVGVGYFVHHLIPMGDLEALARAAPNLQVLDACPKCTYDEALRLMRSEPPFAPLRLHKLSVSFFGIEEVAPFAALLADATLQPTLSKLVVVGAHTQLPEVLDALVGPVIVRRLRCVSFQQCSPPAAVPLARLLRGGALTFLEWIHTFDNMPLLDAAGAALVGDALRNNATLESLYLFDSGLLRDVHAAVAFLGGLVGHRSLYTLHVAQEHTVEIEDPAAIGTALAAIVAADAPALNSLDLNALGLGDAGLAPFVDAIPQNHHLEYLDLSLNGMSEAFARERLLPPVLANMTLRGLSCQEEGTLDPAGCHPAAVEAIAHVERRPR
jgi:hypothetical protein